jgi:hypothetical protein
MISHREAPRQPRRPRATTRLTVVAAIVGAIVVASGAASTTAGSAQSNAGAYRVAPDVIVMFDMEQTNATQDQVTIIFTNSAADPRRPPRPVFDEAIIREFSFSGRDFPKGRPVRFTRRVQDRSFLDARFMRIVNHGTNRWFPETITMTVDGRKILDRLSMYPRKGEATGGIQRWNADQWPPTYWEVDFQRYYRAKAQ